MTQLSTLEEEIHHLRSELHHASDKIVSLEKEKKKLQKALAKSVAMLQTQQVYKLPP
jgi:predicted  nucleic acid-binding Zn-ribbon protein